MALKTGDVPLLKEKLDALARTYHDAYLATDPLGIAHAYKGARDREVAAFLSASLAFGNAAAIRMSVKRIMERLGPRPAAALRSHDPEKSARLFEGLYHRWVGPEAIGSLTQAIGAALRSEGSLEALFLKGYRAEEETLHGALKRFRERLVRSLPATPANARVERGISYLLPDPESGSACKRLHLFLRWMVRPDDGLDLGLWKGPETHQLIIPLDTHIARIGRLLGLTDRKTPDLKMALEITRNLKRIDPADPVRYDFAISRMGILKHCPSKRDIKLCAGCPLQDACRYWRRLPRRRKDAAMQARG
ncbi:MAG: TIGR02757 family protein [Nitrospinae bacterium]|nr:TIGR02757 family protein [Nitrospinota bacterium]